MADPFAAYAVSKQKKDDPFAAYAAPSRELQVVEPDEPSTFMGGVTRSLADTGLKTAKGIGEEALSPLLHPIDTVRGMVSTIRHPIDTATNIGHFVKTAATEGLDPETGGQAIGGLLTAYAAPRVPAILRRGMTRIPTAMIKAGNMAERMGDTARGLSPYALAEAAIMADPKGLAVAAAPYVLKGAGRMISKAGVKMGGRLPAEGASLVRTGAAPLDDALLAALEEARASDTANTPAMKLGGRPKGDLSSSKGPVMSGEVRGGMVTTKPDKWGMSSIRSRADEALSYPRSDEASAFSMARRAERMSPASSRLVKAGNVARDAAPGFSPNEVTGADELERLLNDIHGAGRSSVGNGTFPAETGGPLMRNPRIGLPREGPITWDASAGPALMADDQALLQELRRQTPLVERRLSPLDRYHLLSAEPAARSFKGWLESVGGDVVGHRRLTR